MSKLSLIQKHRDPRTWVSFITILTILFLVCFAPAQASSEKSLSLSCPAPQEDFSLHIDEVRSYLLETQLPQRRPSDVEINLPFQINANPDAVYRGKYLLIHGLNDSPAVWHDIAPELAHRGYDVRGILLPGHGNTPEAQLDVSYVQWLNMARDQLSLWRSDGVPTFIGGFSLGGVIATILAVENDDIAGLFLIAPAYESRMNSLLRWASLVSVFKPWVFGGMIIEDNPAKYNSIPINGAAQYYKTTRYLKRLWSNKKLEMPVFMVSTMTIQWWILTAYAPSLISNSLLKENDC